jgi:DNA-binding Lrp family transcriptional regulator
MAKKIRKKKKRSEYFLTKEFPWYDTGITAVLGADTVAVWEHLYSFIQRGENVAGFDCTAVVKQSKIAVLCGISKRSVIRRIKTLEELGFIIVEGVRDTTKYKLGTWHYDSDGKRNEEIYAIQRVMEAQVVLTTYAETTVESPKKPLVTNVPPEERIEVVKEYFERVREVTSSQEDGDRESLYGDTKTPGIVTDMHDPGDSLALHKVTYNEVPKIEVKNISIQTKNVGVPAPDILPSERSGEGQEVEDAGSAEVLKTRRKNNSAPVTRRVKPTEALLEKVRKMTGAESDAKLRKTQAREDKALNLAGKKTVEGPDRGIRVLANFWEKHYKLNFPEAPFAKLGAKEYGQLKHLVTKYSGPEVKALFDYALNQWELMTNSFKKKPPVPTIGWLLSMHASVIVSAIDYAKVSKVWREWSAWWDANPDETDPPIELENAFEKHKKGMEALGLLRQS